MKFGLARLNWVITKVTTVQESDFRKILWRIYDRKWRTYDEVMTYLR